LEHIRIKLDYDDIRDAVPDWKLVVDVERPLAPVPA